MPTTRPAAVAGRFYPSEAPVLAAMVDELLAAARVDAGPVPKLLILPHAGYVYSGPIAASGYARIAPAAARIRRVILLGPAHRVHLRGMALPSSASFTTPLGQMSIDVAGRARALELPAVIEDDEAHELEHSLEVHLPFLQRLCPHATLVPIVVGRASPREVADVLDALWGDEHTLIVISSDLSHYLDQDEARALDRSTAEWIVSSESPGLDPRRACGAACIDGVVEFARRHPLIRELIDLRNSGDTAGSADRVVGYGAFALHEPARGPRP